MDSFEFFDISNLAHGHEPLELQKLAILLDMLNEWNSLLNRHSKFGPLRVLSQHLHQHRKWRQILSLFHFGTFFV